VGGGVEAWGEEAWLVGVESGASAQEKGFACPPGIWNRQRHTSLVCVLGRV
jgi:hypothetical protein